MLVAVPALLKLFRLSPIAAATVVLAATVTLAAKAARLVMLALPDVLASPTTAAASGSLHEFDFVLETCIKPLIADGRPAWFAPATVRLEAKAVWALAKSPEGVSVEVKFHILIAPFVVVTTAEFILPSPPNPVPAEPPCPITTEPVIIEVEVVVLLNVVVRPSKKFKSDWPT